MDGHDDSHLTFCVPAGEANSRRMRALRSAWALIPLHSDDTTMLLARRPYSRERKGRAKDSSYNSRDNIRNWDKFPIRTPLPRVYPNFTRWTPSTARFSACCNPTAGWHHHAGTLADKVACSVLAVPSAGQADGRTGGPHPPPPPPPPPDPPGGGGVVLGGGGGGGVGVWGVGGWGGGGGGVGVVRDHALYSGGRWCGGGGSPPPPPAPPPPPCWGVGGGENLPTIIAGTAPPPPPPPSFWWGGCGVGVVGVGVCFFQGGAPHPPPPLSRFPNIWGLVGVVFFLFIPPPPPPNPPPPPPPPPFISIKLARQKEETQPLLESDLEIWTRFWSATLFYLRTGNREHLAAASSR